MVFIVVTQRPLLTFFRGDNNFAEELKNGLVDMLEAFVSGARNMIGIGVATAAAGIVVGVVTLTGIGLVMTDFVEFISGGSIMLMLLFTAIISLILGMGLPTTANYIVVSTLMAPVIVTLGAQHGLVIPLIAVHLFVFYFGILADDTPPVGLAAFAAAAIAKADPIRTGIQGFTYDIRTAILPFMFIFNTQLLMIDIEGPLHLFLTVFSATVAMLVFSAATQGWWFTRNKWWETLLLLLVTFSLFRPGFWWDQIYAPSTSHPGSAIFQVAEDTPAGHTLDLRVSGENFDGDQVSKLVRLPVNQDLTSGSERVTATGLELREEDGTLLVDMIAFGSDAERVGIDFDWKIDEVIVANDRPMKEWVFVPTVIAWPDGLEPASPGESLSLFIPGKSPGFVV